MNAKKTKLLISAILVVFALCVIMYFTFFHVNLDKYEWRQPIKESISPDGQYKLEAFLLGEIDELAHYTEGAEGRKNDTYDLYVRVWDCPETLKDGSVMWHDKNTRLIYFKADCTEVEILWADNKTVVINGEALNVDTGRYINKNGG